jgi:signal transduction histidine kinase
MGTWEWEISTSEMTWSPGLAVIHGLAPFAGTFDVYQRDIHPEVREAVLRAIFQTAKQGEDQYIEYRIVLPSGQFVGSRDAGGRSASHPARRLMIDICIDVTERRRTEEALKNADQREGEFLATLAHQLRNPFAAFRSAVRVVHLK